MKEDRSVDFHSDSRSSQAESNETPEMGLGFLSLCYFYHFFFSVSPSLAGSRPLSQGKVKVGENQ